MWYKVKEEPVVSEEGWDLVVDRSALPKEDDLYRQVEDEDLRKYVIQYFKHCLDTKGFDISMAPPRIEYDSIVPKNLDHASFIKYAANYVRH